MKWWIVFLIMFTLVFAFTKIYADPKPSDYVITRSQVAYGPPTAMYPVLDGCGILCIWIKPNSTIAVVFTFNPKNKGRWEVAYYSRIVSKPPKYRVEEI